MCWVMIVGWCFSASVWCSGERYRGVSSTLLHGDLCVCAVLDPRDFWLVLFLDGEDCVQCRVSRTNLVRLSAGVRGLARVGMVNCGAEPMAADGSHGCKRLEAPAPPHEPCVRVYRRGKKDAGCAPRASSILCVYLFVWVGGWVFRYVCTRVVCICVRACVL